MIFGTIAYGVMDNWDIFVRLGANNAQGDIKALPPENDTAESRRQFRWQLRIRRGRGHPRHVLPGAALEPSGD